MLYTLKQRLLINLALATLLLLLAQPNWFLAEASFILGALIYSTTIVWAIGKAPRPQVTITVEPLAIDKLRLYWLMIVASLALGIFYALAFVRFLNAHNGLTMFMVWQGLE